jgi:hypothetical protein
VDHAQDIVGWRDFFPSHCAEMRFTSQFQGFHGEKNIQALKCRPCTANLRIFSSVPDFAENQGGNQKTPMIEPGQRPCG